MLDEESSIQRRNVLSALGAAGTTTLTGCTGGDAGDTDDTEASETTASEGTTNGTMAGGVETIDGGEPGEGEAANAARVYISKIGDLGWSWAYDQARQAVDEQYDRLETKYMETVVPSDSERVFEQYAQGDTDVIFGTTFGYQDPIYAVTKDYPDIVFEHVAGYRTRENMDRYMGHIYEPRYLAGQTTGMVTKSNTIGYVTAFPIPGVVRSVNAMALDAHSINPEATFKVHRVNTWFDSLAAREVANALIDEGCDVIIQEQDSPAVVRAASDAGVWISGCNAPMGQFGGENYLISPIWGWIEFHGPTLKSLHEGSWGADTFWDGIEADVPMLDEWRPNVSQEVKGRITATEEQILNDELDVWADSAFEGENDEFLFQEMSSFIEGVEGETPG